ncbi:MAG: metallophosphoesterase [Peptococcaceae bacterium]|nr:metallophosphoesterase [Peptococcaceae bacterium]
MRLLYLTDTHIQGGTPQNRKDDFLAAMHDKFMEIIALCQRLQIDFVIHGGDLFDVPQPDPRSLQLMRWLLKQLDLPVYCIAGNHDLIEQRIESLDQTALGYLSRNRSVKLLQPGEKVYLANNSCVVQLSGQHYHSTIDRNLHKAGYMIKKRRCDLALHVVHGMLLPKAFSEKVPTTLIDEIAATEADFTLGAHAHLGYHEISNGKYFLNPGALARLTNLKRELTRIPQVIYFDFTSTSSYSFIQLQSVRPGPEVMNLKG